MSELVLVTAFFDINRDKVRGYERTRNDYFKFFEFWARIKNELIVFCNKDDADKIREIRAKHGLDDRTIIHCIDDVYSIESDIYFRMKKIAKDEKFLALRYRYDAIENQAEYDYIMLLKYWFVMKANQLIEKECNFVWFDFGFNHGGEYYKDPEEFNFLWEHEFDGKINCFCIDNPSNSFPLDDLLFFKDCFHGSPVIIPSSLSTWFWEKIKDAMYSLLSIGCIDDDQQLILMVYKNNNEYFSYIQCGWFEGLNICSNNHFKRTVRTVIDTNCRSNSDSTIIRIKRHIKKIINKLLRRKTKSHIDLYVERIQEILKKYYG